MGIEKLLKESENIFKDLNLIFEHMNKHDGKYLCFLKASVVVHGDRRVDGYIDINNLDISELYECFSVFISLLKKSLASSEKCKCEKCLEATEKFKIVLNKLESE